MKKEEYMDKAIELAKKAMDEGEIPVGAVVVLNDEIIGEGYNKTQQTYMCSRHAEIIAIEMAEEKLNSRSLSDCDMYVTLEPCMMCAGAIQQAKIKNVYIGTKEPKMGAFGSKMDLTTVQGLNHYPIVFENIRKEECEKLLKIFFKKIRKEKTSKQYSIII